MIRPAPTAAVAALLAAGPAFALTPDQELARAWALFHYPKYDNRAANAAANAYLRTYGPRFSAAFLAAATQCLLNKHNPANRAAFMQLRHDYFIGGNEATTVAEWITSDCANPRPQAETGGQALSSTPATAAAEPSDHEPPPRNPRPAPPPPPPPRVIASPVVANAAAPVNVKPAACRARDTLLGRDPAVYAATVAALERVCNRELASTAPATAPPSAPPPAAAPDPVLPPEVQAANAERRRRYLAAQCRPPYVWRDAFYLDRVCVTPQVRDDAADDNRHRAERRDPTGPYGPMTCIQGYVWRGARDGDTVCVVPERRDQAAADNAAAASRRLVAGVPGSG